MFKVGRDTGSLVNHVYGSAKQIAPKVGMGATILMWTDRHAATIVKVTPKQIHVQRDRAKRTDSRGFSESQDYEYTSCPTAPVEIFRLTKRGWRSKGGSGLLVGNREEYWDPCF